ncbi:unnamed protein product [Alopecurus aequalis]
MASGSVSSSVLHRRPFIPIVNCPTCGRTIQQKTPWTPKHSGWVFYRCPKHEYGCNFWHWELEYVEFLVENKYVRGDDAVDALGWAEERREELLLRKEEKSVTGAGAENNEELILKTMTALLDGVQELLLVVKIGVAALVFLCVVAIVKK